MSFVVVAAGFVAAEPDYFASFVAAVVVDSAVAVTAAVCFGGVDEVFVGFAVVVVIVVVGGEASVVSVVASVAVETAVGTVHCSMGSRNQTRYCYIESHQKLLMVGC